MPPLLPPVPQALRTRASKGSRTTKDQRYSERGSVCAFSNFDMVDSRRMYLPLLNTRVTPAWIGGRSPGVRRRARAAFGTRRGFGGCLTSFLSQRSVALLRLSYPALRIAD